MAKALQCPKCGTKKRIDSLGGSGTFECSGCGQVTKVPPGLHDDHRGRARRSAPEPVVAGVSSRDGGAPAPPKRRSGGAAAAGAPAPDDGGTAALATPSDADDWSGKARGSGAVAAPPARGAARRSAPIGVEGFDDEPAQVRLVWRILAWLVALPIALAVVGIPARRAGYLNSQRLLDVIVDKNLTRFVPIVVIIVLWALVTAVLVTAILAVFQRLKARRRARRHA